MFPPDVALTGTGKAPHEAAAVGATAAPPSARAGRLALPGAIVHDWFQGYHGSERVVEAMREGLFEPGHEPDVLTFHAARELLPPLLAAAIVKESRLADLPWLRQEGHDPGRWRYLLPTMPRYFAGLDLDPYDLVIASSHACSVHVRPREDATFVCYCHTPIRYAWMPETEARRAHGFGGFGLKALRGWLRRKDREAAQRPDGYVAISEAVRERIQRFYGRDAEVIHPPVDVDDFHPGREKEPGRFLWAHRLVAYKHPEVVIEAFRGLPYRLTMVGVGPLESRLREGLPPNVELRGWVSREELAHLYAEASGFLHVGEEDFGITMVEALASGTPVVGLERGGARDIVRPGVDGVLVDRPEPEAVRDAVRKVAESEWDTNELTARARTFSRERFLEQLLDYVGALHAR
jgi:glycosyltransferase involved in cell wall biosynthesis